MSRLIRNTARKLATMGAGFGAYMVALSDGAGGGVLWTTVAGFVEKIISSAGASVIGFIQSAAGAVERNIQSKIEEFVSVLDFGAVGDGVTDCTSFIQAAIDYCVSSGKKLYVPSGTYMVTGTGIAIANSINVYGDGQFSIIKNASGNVLRIQGSRVKINDLHLYSVSGGHVVSQTGNLNFCDFDNLFLTQDSGSYSLWENSAYLYISVKLQNSYLKHVVGATVPGINHAISGVNDNVFENLTVYGSGNYFFNLEATTAVAQYHNVLRDIVFEVCTGGGIRLVGNQGYVIDTCINWDADVSGPVLKHFFSIERHASLSVGSRGTFRNCARWAGVNNAGIYDIVLPISGLGSGTVIESCTAAGTGSTTAFTVDAVGNKCTFISPPSQFLSFNDSLCLRIGGNNGMNSYIEGLFTPTVRGDGVAGVGTYIVQYGSFTKTGNRVSFQMVVQWSAHTGTGNVVVGGLPYSSAETYRTPVVIGCETVAFTGSPLGYVQNGATDILCKAVVSGAVQNNISLTGSGLIYVSGTYKA